MSKKEELLENGIVLYKQFFSPKKIKNLKNKSCEIFQRQFDKFGYNSDFNTNMFRLFEEHNEIFINCGKTIQQGLIELYNLSIDKKILKTLKKLGIKTPNMCTRPVLFFNHPKLAKDVYYYKTPPHQDWPSMLASHNSLVVWIPLINVNSQNGSVIFYPGSQKLGPLDYKSIGGFAKVDIPTGFEPVQIDLEVGDIVIFSTLLIHESGDIINDEIRWSCHFRYTDLDEEDFIDRGFPSPYIYKPDTKK